jgi:hypothetical protein
MGKAEMECGCQIVLQGHGIQYCSKHAAAPELYEALKYITDTCRRLGYLNETNSESFQMSMVALAKAEGK